MASGYPDYQAFEIPVLVPSGGTGHSSLTTNGVLLGADTAPVTVTAAGAANEVFRVPAAGGAPAFGPLDLSQAAAVTGLLPVAHGGTGTATGSITGTGALTFAAGGTNQNVELKPSGAGYTILNGSVGINTSTPTVFGGVSYGGATFLQLLAAPTCVAWLGVDGTQAALLLRSNDGPANRRLVRLSQTNYFFTLTPLNDDSTARTSILTADVEASTLVFGYSVSAPSLSLTSPLPVASGGTGQNNLDPLNVATLKASPGAAEIGATIQLAALPTADAIQVLNSAAALVFRVEAFGETHAFARSVDSVPFVANLMAGQTADAMQVQDSGSNPLFEITAGGSLIIEPSDPVWIGLVVKGAPAPTHDLVQLKDNANNILVEVQKQGAVVLNPVDTQAIPLTCVMPAGASTSAIAVEDSSLNVLFGVSAKGAALVNPTDTVTIPLTLKMPALATARAFEVQNSAAAVLLQVGPDGETVINPTATTSIPLVLKFPAANTAMALQVQNSAAAVLAGFGADGQLTLNPTAAATIPLVITCPATPTAKALQVKSNAGAVLMSVGNDGAISAASCSLTTPLAVASGGTGTATQFTAGSIVFAGASGVYAQDNTNLFWDNTNKRLGIGTTTPGTTLVVSSGLNVARFGLTGSGQDNYITFVGNTNNFDVGVTTGGFWGVAEAGVAYRFVVTADGKVGIGTTEPGQLLHVVKARQALIKVQSAEAASPDTGFTIVTTDRTWNLGQNIGNVGAGKFNFYDVTAEASRVVIDTSGNVGIGTTGPKSPLHVVGLPVYANNAAAVAGGLTAGAFYRTGADPDPVCVVH